MNDNNNSGNNNQNDNSNNDNSNNSNQNSNQNNNQNASVCGNNTIEAGELCDGSDLGNATCLTVSSSFTGGDLACLPGCDGWDTEGCHFCGNGRIDPDEVCDGTNLGGATCEALGYGPGVLACQSSCDLDTAPCLPGPHVSIDDCIIDDERGSFDHPWCTIAGGVQAAQAAGLPAVYVKAGVYTQGTQAAVPETLVFEHAPAGDPEILGGFLDLARLTRAPEPSCDATDPNEGATVILTDTHGVWFQQDSRHTLERFCVRSASPASTSAQIFISDGTPTIRGNIVDASRGGLVGYTYGIKVESDLSSENDPVLTIEDNRDEPEKGRYFGGDGLTNATGIYLETYGPVLLRNNRVHVGLGAQKS